MTRVNFGPVFQRLARQLGKTITEPAIVEDYFEALKDLPLEAVTEAADTLSKSATWFPKTSEWREAAALVHRKLLQRAVHEPRGEPWRHDCHDCEDTGWVQGLECPGDVTCGRPRPHAPHSYTRACPCRATNRTYLRHHHVGGGVS